MSDAVDGMRDPRKLRVRVGLTFVRTLRPALYVLLVASALLTFWAGGGIGGREQGDDVQVLLRSSDPRVRALAAEVAGYRAAAQYAADLVDRLDDNEPAVRSAAHAALVRIVGQDATPGGEGPAAQRRWREVLRARGLLR